MPVALAHRWLFQRLHTRSQRKLRPFLYLKTKYTPHIPKLLQNAVSGRLSDGAKNDLRGVI